MKPSKLLGILILLSLLLAGLSTPAVTSPLAQAPGASAVDLSKVDPAVLDQLAVDGEAEFYVILAVQADLSGATALPTKVVKTTYVFNLLRETARQTQMPLTRYLDQQGLDYRAYYIANMIEVTGDRGAVEWLAARPDVARISVPPDPRQEPVIHDAAPQPERVSAIEWNITRVGAPDVWAMGYHGEGMVVAGNDTGVDYTHPALVNQYRGNLGGSFNHNYNWWGGTGSPAPVDGDGHGTHTMGTMVGDDGGANQVGMAPGAQWIACAGLGGADTVECFEFFLAPWDLNHANPDPTKAPDSINNSWYDTSGFDYRPIIQSLNAAGVAVIKSAGNWGSDCDTISPPGNVPEIIATAAFAQGDTIASFSSRGPSSTYGPTILKPEVAAPGVNIRSSVPGGGYEGGWDGTSMAAPHSTGLVALIWSAAPCLRGDVPTTKQIMMETAESKIDAQCPPFVDHPNDVWGWGILDAEAAVQMAIGYCGGLGGLQGTVTSAKAPLQDVAVRAQAAGGYNKTAYTDAAGLYAIQVLSDTYTVTATKYGYAPSVIPGVEVTTDMTTTLDIVMTALAMHTVSGYVRDSVTNAPLAAVLQFTDAPEPPVNTDPATGFYSIQVAEGTWHLRATAPSHLAVTQEVAVYGNVTQDFHLDPLPCILLVDDDGNNPDVRSYYTQALDTLGVDYNIWDLATQGDPAAADLIGYKMVVWFNGYPYSSTFTGANEAAVAAYLDTGGNLLFSSQDYLYDAGLTAFGQNYLHISSFTSDVSVTSVTGANVYAGLGSYTLSYPFTNYSDRVNPDALAQVAFTYSGGNTAVSYNGVFKTVFLGYPLEAVPLAGRTAILERTLEYFGGCGCEAVAILDVTAEVTGCTATFSADVAGDPPLSYAWDFGAFGTSADPAPVVDFGVSGTYPYSLTVYNCAGASSDTITDTVTVECCEEVYNPGFSWEPVSPLEDQEVLFTGVASGTAPITFSWDWGDGAFGAGQTATHTYATGGEYTVVMTATNCAGSVATSTQTVTVRSKTYIYLPIVLRGE